MPHITPHLWVDGTAEEAAQFYCSIFPNSRILSVNRAPMDNPSQPAGAVLYVEFELDGTRFTALNGGPLFRFNEAVSFQIDCADQAEVDHYWDRLTEGGEESQCGWLKDRYGLSWQVVPQRLGELLSNPDRDAARRAGKAMLGMKKLDITALEQAASGR